MSLHALVEPVQNGALLGLDQKKYLQTASPFSHFARQFFGHANA
jgi:hypothetical protein